MAAAQRLHVIKQRVTIHTVEIDHQRFRTRGRTDQRIRFIGCSEKRRRDPANPFALRLIDIGQRLHQDRGDLIGLARLWRRVAGGIRRGAGADTGRHQHQ